MMTTYLVTIGLILILMLGGIVVDRTYKLFARRHPELGPFRNPEGGCGCCSGKDSCSSGSCESSAGH
jgi:hypothetical protein